MIATQTVDDRTDLPLPRPQEELGEVSGTRAADQPRGTTTRLRGICRQQLRLPRRESEGGRRGRSWGGGREGMTSDLTPYSPQRNRRERRERGKREADN